MLFRNWSDEEVSWLQSGVTYTVAPDETIEVPDENVMGVRVRNLPLIYVPDEE